MRRYTKEIMEEAVRSNESIAGICRYFGISTNGGNHRSINQRIKEYQLDTSHFSGQAWSKGLTGETCESIRTVQRKVTIWTDEKVFVKNSGYPNTKLKFRLLKLGWAYECKFCQLSEWRGKEIRLQVDHINGDHVDNRLENLRFLCPNCHSQTDTFGNKTLVDSDGTSLRRKPEPQVRKKYFCECGEEKRKKSKNCKNCRKFDLQNNFKIEWPDKETLEKMIWEKPATVIAQDLGISDSAIAHKCKQLDIKKPPRGYWLRSGNNTNNLTKQNGE